MIQRSQELGMLFIHIPRTGGTSIKKAFKYWNYPYSGGFPKDSRIYETDIELFGLKEETFRNWYHHLPLSEVRRIVSETEWGNLLKFAVVRNPWDRAVSTYSFMMTKEKWQRKHPKAYGELCKDGFLGRIKKGGLVWRLQEEYLWLNGKMQLDFLIRFEHYRKDLQQLCNRLHIGMPKLPHKGKSSHGSYREYYDEEAKEIIAEKEKAIIEYMGYTF